MDPVQVDSRVKTKAQELGLSEEFMAYALDILCKNRDLVNAIDKRTEMDEYIYRSIIKTATDRRRQRAEEDLNNSDDTVRQQAEKDLSLLSREEIMADPYYRAVLPVIAKVVANEPILRLHVEEAAVIVLELADFKRRHRATSVTEVLVTKCKEVLESYSD